MVNAETMAQVPEDVLLYLRALCRRLIELEQTDPQQRIAELEAANRGLQVELDDALALIARQQQQIGQLQQQLADAQARLNTNSGNSSLPPSSDRFSRQRKSRSLRQKSERKQGGQPGHQGHTLQMSPEPDETILLAPVTHCEHCQADLTEMAAKTVERRQVIDVPAPPPLHVRQ